MNPKRRPPVPILDNLDQAGNPFQQNRFSAAPYLDKPVRGASTDLAYVLKFLYSYRGSPATYHSYRRELERLLQWAWRIEAVSVLTLKREQIEAFIQFCGQPPLAWIGTKQVPRFLLREGERVANPAWRPFVTTVAKADFRAGARSPAPGRSDASCRPVSMPPINACKPMAWKRMPWI